MIGSILSTVVIAITADPFQTAHATETSVVTSPPYITASQAIVTDKVFFDVRISRKDGTFYVRDDLDDSPGNRVFYGRLVVGLFGKNAPRHVENFLTYLPRTLVNPLDDNPMPSYGRSQFTRFDQATGVLYGGTIPGLQLTEFAGSAALQYSGRLLPANLWMERGPLPLPPRISHAERGLLTHAQFDATPVFGITTRRDATELDGTHTVFGRILLDESSTEFLTIVQELPTYGMERPMNTASDPDQTTFVEEAAQAIFTSQRQFFRNTAKTFGDSRLDKIYEGKLLRRVEVTQVGFL